MTTIRIIGTTFSPCAWFGPEDGPRASSVRSFVVQLPPPPSRSELQPPYQSLVAYWSKQREEREKRRGRDGVQAEERELSRATVNTTTSKGLLRWRERGRESEFARI